MNTLAHLRAVAPTAVGLFAAGQLCAAMNTPSDAGLIVAVTGLYAVWLIAARRGAAPAAEALLVSLALFCLHHSVEVLSLSPLDCGSYNGTFSCTVEVGWRELAVVVFRLALAVLLVIAVHLFRQSLQRFVLRVWTRLAAQSFGLRQLVSCRARYTRSLQRMVRSTPRRGPPTALLAGL